MFTDMPAVEQPVEERGDHDLVAEDAAPLLEALAGQCCRAVAVAPVD